MRVAIAEGCLYKFNKYSDRSAIAYAYTKEYGCIKLFASSIANKSSVLIRHIPGTIHFYHNASSDMHKLITFQENLNYAPYLDDPEIYTRLSMVFEMIHHNYSHTDPIHLHDSTVNENNSQDTKITRRNDLWYLLTKFTKETSPKLTLYILFTILSDSGYMFSPWACNSCGSSTDKEEYVTLTNTGETVCSRCLPISEVSSHGLVSTHHITRGVLNALEKFHDSDAFREMLVDRAMEYRLLAVLFFHASHTINHRLHSYEQYKLVMPD